VGARGGGFVKAQPLRIPPLQAKPVPRHHGGRVTGKSDEFGATAPEQVRRPKAVGERSELYCAPQARLAIGKRSAQRRKARRRQGWKPEWGETSAAPARWRSHDSPVPAPPGDAQASTSHTRKRKREPRPPLLSNRHNGFALALRGVLHVLAHQVHAVHLLTVFLVLGGLQSPFDENL
jgi:hypothetical protein